MTNYRNERRSIVHAIKAILPQPIVEEILPQFVYVPPFDGTDVQIRRVRRRDKR
jgi:hypothetical protein